MAKKKIVETPYISDVKELEVVDSKYYTFNANLVDGKSEKKFVFSPTAKVIGLVDFPTAEFFINKNDKGVWIISESITGTFVYKSKENDNKAVAIKNAIEYIKNKIKGKTLMDVINEKIKITGISPRYRNL